MQLATGANALFSTSAGILIFDMAVETFKEKEQDQMKFSSSLVLLIVICFSVVECWIYWLLTER
jgi:hypothetical protein